MERKRIQVYADPEIKRRVELAAAKRAVSVTEYCLEAITEQLIEDDLLERETIEVPVRVEKDEDLIADLRALRERILIRRGGVPLDADILDRVREERDYEITSLR